MNHCLSIGLKEVNQPFLEYLFDKMTFAREIDVSDMQEFLKPLQIPGVSEDPNQSLNYPQAAGMKPEEMFNMILKIEFVFYRNMEKTRSDIQSRCLALNSAPRQVLSSLFDSIQDNRSGEPSLSGERLNNFLLSDPGRLSIISSSDFSVITFVMNGCNLHKIQRINKNTFVNFFLPADQRNLLDQSAISQKMLDQSREDQVNQSVKSLFDQINPNMLQTIVQQCFTADPRAVKFHSQQTTAAQNIMPNNILNPQANTANQGPLGTLPFNKTTSPNKNLTRLVMGGDIRSSNIDSYQPLQQVPQYTPSRPVSNAQSYSIDRPQLQQIATKIERTTPQIFAEEENYLVDKARVLPPQEKPKLQPVATSKAGNPHLIPLSESELNALEPKFTLPSNPGEMLFQSQPRVSLIQNSVLPPQVEILNESAFMRLNQPENPVRHNSRTNHELKNVMDSTVRNNLKKYEFDF